MFGRHLRRRWHEMEWDDEAPRHEHHNRFGRPVPWQRGPFPRHGERWFMPPHHRGGPPWGRGGPCGGGPGDDRVGEAGGGRRRQRRGDIKYVLLELLAEQPRHGYELIKELESRYGGFYRPSPGSVYPTLQLLEDEGHLTSSVADGKRVYTITDSGRQLLQERQANAGEREGFGPRGFRPGRMSPELGKLRESSMGLMASLMQLALHGTPEQVRAAQEMIDATRREIYGLLAAGESESADKAE
jgi:DNA-binding PadR family transcriptional regulator